MSEVTEQVWTSGLDLGREGTTVSTLLAWAFGRKAPTSVFGTGFNMLWSPAATVRVLKEETKRETECPTPKNTRLLHCRCISASSSRSSALVCSKVSLSLRNMMRTCVCAQSYQSGIPASWRAMCTCTCMMHHRSISCSTTTTHSVILGGYRCDGHNNLQCMHFLPPRKALNDPHLNREAQ